MSLHNVVPHVHHDHENEHTEHKHHAHDGHQHHHDEESNDHKGLDDILILLLGDHAHSFLAYESDVDLRPTQTLHQFTQLDLMEPCEVMVNRGLEEVYRHHLFKPLPRHNTYFTFTSLRAPPVLG